MEQHYKKSIQILQKGDIDFESIVWRLIEHHPDIFVSLYYDEGGIRDEVLKVLDNDSINKISAIKKHREITNATLKESNDYVTKLITDYGMTPRNFSR